MLGDEARVRAIFELAICQPALDMPELLWKAYIDFEFGEGERDRTRALYERLLEKSKHLKIWLAYARFEMARLGAEDDEEEPEDGDEDAQPDPAKARTVYQRAYRYFKDECNRIDIKDDVESLRKVKTQVWHRGRLMEWRLLIFAIIAGRTSAQCMEAVRRAVRLCRRPQSHRGH